jgi:hypothetical protein
MPGGARGADGTAGSSGAGGGGIYAKGRYFFRVIMASPLACGVCGEPFSTQSNLSKHEKWNKKCGGKHAPKRRGALLKENAIGEKVTVLDVDENVVFLEVKEQEIEKGNFVGKRKKLSYFPSFPTFPISSTYPTFPTFLTFPIFLLFLCFLLFLLFQLSIFFLLFLLVLLFLLFLVWSGLVWSGLVWSGLVWSGLV